MKRTFILLLGLAVAPLWAADAARPVVVDPLDLRKPVPDPEGALTEKYDGKLVRFTGVVRRVTADPKTRQARYELQHQIVSGTGKRAVVKETIVVAVTFAKAERALRADLSPRAPAVTVEGKGSVMVDGSLVITEATIVPEAKRPSSGR
jgi:hypothetical protein